MCVCVCVCGCVSVCVSVEEVVSGVRGFLTHYLVALVQHCNSPEAQKVKKKKKKKNEHCLRIPIVPLPDGNNVGFSKIGLMVFISWSLSLSLSLSPPPSSALPL